MNTSNENNNESVLLSLIGEEQLKSIVESAVRKIMLELKEDAPEVDEWLTSDQVCRLLHVSKSTIVNWRSAGKLKSHKIGSRILFKREQVLAKINELRPFMSVELLWKAMLTSWHKDHQ